MARITQGPRTNCAACYGGRGNSEAPTAIEAWGARSSTSTLGVVYAGLYNQRSDVEVRRPRKRPHGRRNVPTGGFLVATGYFGNKRKYLKSKYKFKL